MSRDFNSTNRSDTAWRFLSRAIWDVDAYPENNGLGGKSIKDFHFKERLHYGVIDNLNNSVIPNEDFLVNVGTERVFDFVADSYSLAKLNCLAAINKGQLSPDSILGTGLNINKAYEDPRAKYAKYLNNILQYYNETYIPNTLGTTSIASYLSYVKNFFDFYFKQDQLSSLTLTRWLASNKSSILDTGLAFSFADIPYDEDQRKIDEIIDRPEFGYIQNLALNMGFSIMHYNPNIMVYDLSSPASRTIRTSYGLYNLNTIFNERYIKTYSIDNNILYNRINLYYNKYAQKNSSNRVVSVKNCKTVSEYFTLDTVQQNRRPYTDEQELEIYCKIRNKEEGSLFTPQKIRNIYKKSKYLMKKLDKDSGMSYINNMFRDQVWNKNNGYHDLKAKLEGRTQTEAQRQQTGGSPSSGGSSY